MRTLILFLLVMPFLLSAEDQAKNIPREKRYPDIGKLHIEESKLLYGLPTSSERLHGGVTVLRWSRTSDRAPMDDWISKPYQRIPPNGHVDPTSSFTMALTFDKNGILSARRFEGNFPGFGDYDVMFRKP